MVQRGAPAAEFGSFMDPRIDWITPAEYAAAFDGMIADEELATLAADRQAKGEPPCSKPLRLPNDTLLDRSAPSRS